MIYIIVDFHGIPSFMWGVVLDLKPFWHLFFVNLEYFYRNHSLDTNKQPRLDSLRMRCNHPTVNCKQKTEVASKVQPQNDTGIW